MEMNVSKNQSRPALKLVVGEWQSDVQLPCLFNTRFINMIKSPIQSINTLGNFPMKNIAVKRIFKKGEVGLYKPMITKRKKKIVT